MLNAREGEKGRKEGEREEGERRKGKLVFPSTLGFEPRILKLAR